MKREVKSSQNKRWWKDKEKGGEAQKQGFQSVWQFLECSGRRFESLFLNIFRMLFDVLELLWVEIWRKKLCFCRGYEFLKWEGSNFRSWRKGWRFWMYKIVEVRVWAEIWCTLSGWEELPQKNVGNLTTNLFNQNILINIPFKLVNFKTFKINLTTFA